MQEQLCLLEERLIQHDESRKEVQKQLCVICIKAREEADALEENINREMRNAFEKREEETFSIIEKLIRTEENSSEVEKEAQQLLSNKQKCQIKNLSGRERFDESYKLFVTSQKTKKQSDFDNAGSIIKIQEKLDGMQDSMKAAQEKLAEICNRRRSEAEELDEKINKKLEPIFVREDARIQSVVKIIKEKINSEKPEERDNLIRKAKQTLLLNQQYKLVDLHKGNLVDRYELVIVTEPFLNAVDFEEMKPTISSTSFTGKGEVSLSFAFFSDEFDPLKQLKSSFEVVVMVWQEGCNEDTAKTFTKTYVIGDCEHVLFDGPFASGTTYCLKMKIAHSGLSTQWSDVAESTTQKFSECCAWKECPDYIDDGKKYSLDENNPKIASFNGYTNFCCTIIGNASIPSNVITSWSVKVLKSCGDDGKDTYIGVAPFDIDQNTWDNTSTCGWYLCCYSSVLVSGPPHDRWDIKYGPRKEKNGQYVHNGDSVGVVMDTAKGELSFILNNVNLGVAYEEVPLDKPLVPCVILGCEGDCVELVV